MQKGPKLPGFRYLYASDKPQAVVVHLRDAVFRAHEWLVTRDNVAEVCGKILVELPVYLAERGTYAEIEAEILRWRSPEFYEIFGNSRHNGSQILTCSSCQQKNRVNSDPARSGTPKCGRCGSRL